MRLCYCVCLKGFRCSTSRLAGEPAPPLHSSYSTSIPPTEPYADLGLELGLGLNELGRAVSLFLSIELQFLFEDYCGLGSLLWCGCLVCLLWLWLYPIAKLDISLLVSKFRP